MTWTPRATSVAIGGVLLSLVVTLGVWAPLYAQPGRQARQRAEPRLNLSGTYTLESTRGDDSERVARQATRSLPPGQRDQAYNRLTTRLTVPRVLSITQDGRMVTIASSKGVRSSFEADGQSRSERNRNDDAVFTRAELFTDRLVVTSTGGRRGSDFSVTFESLRRGEGLRVTRRLDDEALNRAIVVQSEYRRTDVMPVWEGSGTVAILETRISMRNSRDGSPFVLSIRDNGPHQGSRIDGIVRRVGNTRSGNDGDIQLECQTMTRSNGRPEPMDLWIESVRLPDGRLLQVSNLDEETSRGDTRSAVQGGAIGAAVGAIAGGGKGAAVGAFAGAAGGIILSKDHEDLDLPAGTEVTLRGVPRRR